MDPARRRRIWNDPLNISATVLFGVADVLAITSISLPKWLTGSDTSSISIGLLSSCLTVPGRPTYCYTPETIQPEWILTFLFILIGILGLTIAAGACVVSFFRNPLEAMSIARFGGLLAIIFFNMAQILFASAFAQDQIGGLAFQLPQNFYTGASYGLFFVSHWMTVASELCAAKICRPRWQF